MFDTLTFFVTLVVLYGQMLGYRLHVFISAIRIFMYEMHQICNDYYALMAHDFKKILW